MGNAIHVPDVHLRVQKVFKHFQYWVVNDVIELLSVFEREQTGFGFSASPQLFQALLAKGCRGNAAAVIAFSERHGGALSTAHAYLQTPEAERVEAARAELPIPSPKQLWKGWLGSLTGSVHEINIVEFASLIVLLCCDTSANKGRLGREAFRPAASMRIMGGCQSAVRYEEKKQDRQAAWPGDLSVGRAGFEPT